MKTICRILIPVLLVGGGSNFLSFNALASSAEPGTLYQTQNANDARKWEGVIVDVNGEPVPGVAVFIVGNTASAAITDAKGAFSISARPGEDIQVSCLGYETLTVKAGSALQRIILRDEAQVLQSSVVTALGIKRDEKAIGYSAQKVEAEKFSNSGTTGNWLNGISGQVAGLNIDRTNSGAGGSMRVTIRGESTADLENNTALFVVDGVPMYNTSTMSEQAEGSSFVVDYGNGTADIDPDNIESVTVLKGAAATALYGSQA
ncbi:MAG: TonB-dependent receptor plug domain-containing protein, partial [Bacteroidales bacterium]|nr:TonB-dependent receptor plug domain-containing protein [Bacteroidales bacterium]